MEVEQEPIEVHDSEEETTPEAAPEPAQETPDEVKEKGNAAFKAGKYQEAIDNYSRAIGMSSLVHARTRRRRSHRLSQVMLTIATHVTQTSVRQNRRSGRTVRQRTWL